MSRVRKPPGGDSSFNIFGIANEPTNAKKVTEDNNRKVVDNSNQNATDNSQKAKENSIETAASNELGTCPKTDDTVTKEEGTCEKAEDKNDVDQEKKDVEAEEEKDLKESADQNSAIVAPTSAVVKDSATKDSPAKDETQNTPESTKNKAKAAYNPITGEPYGSPDVGSNKTEVTAKTVGHTRVRQPPGGASSKLW